MSAPEPFLVFTRVLNELGLPHIVSGGVAAIYYGEPRLTNDIDMIVAMKAKDIPGLERAFPLEVFYRPPTEVIEMELGRSQRGCFDLIHEDSSFKADINLGGRDELNPWGFAHVRRIQLENDSLRLAPPESVIVRKLQFHREGRSEKHLRGISRMLVSQGEEWDRTQLATMIEEQGLQAEWQQGLGSER